MFTRQNNSAKIIGGVRITQGIYVFAIDYMIEKIT